MKKLPKGAKDITSEFRTELGWTAGRLWNYLGQNGKVAIETLLKDYEKIATPGMIKLLDPKWEKVWTVLLALGWLAAEGKVIIDGQTGSDRWLNACLTGVEQGIYNGRKK